MTLFKFHFVDDHMILAKDFMDMDFMIRKLYEEYEKWGLYLFVGGKAEVIGIGAI